MKKALVLAAWGAGAALGCGKLLAPENPRVEVRTELLEYAAGDRAELTVHNRHHESILLTTLLCGSTIERRVGGGWEVVGSLGNPDPHDGSASSTCLMGLVELLPGGTYSVPFAVDHRFATGEPHRFGVHVTHARSGQRRLEVSPPFAIAR